MQGLLTKTSQRNWKKIVTPEIVCDKVQNRECYCCKNSDAKPGFSKDMDNKNKQTKSGL